MELFDKQTFRKLYENKPAVSSYGCLMLAALEVPFFQELQDKISKNDIFDDDGTKGLEQEPHITIKYGLKDWEFDSFLLNKILANVEPLKYNLGNVTLFKNPEFEVLKVNVESMDLVNLNYTVSKLPNEDKYPIYIPHLTLAYLKPGTGKKYIGSRKIHEMFSDKIIWSPSEKSMRKDDEKRIIELAFLNRPE